MWSKDYFRKTEVVLFSLLSGISLITAGIMYITTSIYSDKQLWNYKIAYYTEQTYKMSYFLSSNIEGKLNEKENNRLYDELSTEFSTRYELLDKELEEIIYQAGLTNSGIEEPFHIEAPIILDGILLGYMRAHYDLDGQAISPSFVEYQKNIKSQRAFVTKATIIFLIICSFLVAKFLSIPIKATFAMTLKVLQGKRYVNVPQSGTLEMRYLVDSVNLVLVEFNNMEDWRKQMMEDLTHELRTPLTSVLLMMEAIIDGVYPTSKKNLQDIYQEVDRLSRLIFNVQNLSEAEGAKFRLNIEKINITPLIKSTYEGFLFVAKQKNIKMHFNHPNRPCVAEVDADRFIQVITNLISNALKYTPDGGKVEIGLDIYPEEFVLYCLDNGIGLSEEEQKLVFNRFYRVEKSRSRENGGSGIGLNISNALVQAHGWELGVQSEVDVGSRFWVAIPISNEVDPT